MIEDIEINPQSINSNINISPNISVNNDNIPEPFISNHTMTHAVFPDKKSEVKISIKEAIRKHILAKLKNSFPSNNGKDGNLEIKVESLTVYSKNNMPVCISLFDCLLATFTAGANVNVIISFLYVQDGKEVFKQKVEGVYESERKLRKDGESAVDVIRENIGKAIDQATSNLLSQLSLAVSFKSDMDDVIEKSNINEQKTNIAPTSMDEAIIQCEEIGYVKGTDEFGECVMVLIE